MRRGLKWLATGSAVLLTLVVLSAGALALRGRGKRHRTYQVPRLLTAIATDSLTLARGEHLVTIHRCQDCHGPGLRGEVLFDIPPLRLQAPNLTRGDGGIGGAFTDQDWDRAIRHGVRPSGEPLLRIMPYELFNHLDDADAAAVIAYAKSLPPVDRQLPVTDIRLLGDVLLGLPRSDYLTPVVESTSGPAPPLAATAAYGKYLTSHICTECHGLDLGGGQHPSHEGPLAPGLAAAGTWPFQDFARAVHTGVAPGGRTLASYMPVKGILDHLSDVELQALYAYLQTLGTPPVAHP